MAFSHAIIATSFAALCSIVWLMTGGSAFSALGLYLLSGQMAFLSLFGRAAITHWMAARKG